MSYFEYPHSRTYDNDLGWLIRHVVEMQVQLSEFIKFNTIKYADPIEWNITSQYESNTIVTDSDGTAYLSVQPVPSGVNIINTDYWTPIFNYGASVETLREQIAPNDEQNSATVTNAYVPGDLFWQRDYLYRVIVDMPAGTAILPGTNVVHTTIEDEIKRLFEDFEAAVTATIEEFETEVSETLEEGLQSKISGFDTVADMKADSVLAAGDYARTGGYYTAGVGGALYKIVAEAPETYYETLDSGLYAQMIFEGFIYPEQFGAYGDGIHDDSNALQTAISSGNAVKLRAGASYETFDTALYITTDNFSLDGQGARILKNRQSTRISEMLRTDNHNFITIKNVEFYGDLDVSNIWSEHIHGVCVNNSAHVNIEGCRFDNIEGDGVYIGGLGRASDVQVKNCYFGKTGRWCITVIDGVGILISSNLFYENHTSCMDIEPNAVTQTSEVVITGNSSIRCAELVNLAYGRNHTDLSIVIDGWHSFQDSISRVDTSKYPDKVDVGLFSMRLTGGSAPEGDWILKNITVIKATGRIFYERVASAQFDVNISDLLMLDCSGTEAFYSRTDWTGAIITRQISLSYDKCSYTNFAHLMHPDDVARGDIIYNVHKTGDVPSSILDHTYDAVNLYDVKGILTSKAGNITTDAGQLVVDKVVSYEHFIMYLIYFTPSANIAANGKVFDFTTGEGNTGWYFFGGGQPVFFYDNGTTIRTHSALTAGTSYRGYIIYMGK